MGALGQCYTFPLALPNAKLPLLGLRLDRTRTDDAYPFTVPSLGKLTSLKFPTPITFLVGENGSGKSTLLEGIARALDYSLEGGSSNMKFPPTRQTATMDRLGRALRLEWSRGRAATGFFLRAESMFHVANYLDEMSAEDQRTFNAYGGRSLHDQSHGESFLATIQNRCDWPGVYLFDEPEAALSPQRQLTVLSELHAIVQQPGRQFLIASHSPILLAYPGATIYEFSAEGIKKVAYEETASYRVTRDFLASPERFLRHLLDLEEG